MEALADFPAATGADWIRRGIDGGPDALADAPDAVRAFFASVETPPDWFDADAVLPGCRAFHRNSEMFIGAFVAAVLIEGFCTLISQSFSITARLVDQGVRRLKQNNRHIVEIFLPGGLERQGDGWKLSVRIRLVHARVRRLLQRSDEWDEAAWGTPLSAAHIAYATAAFSARLLLHADKLGVRMTPEERDSFMGIWRYSGHLMGVPPALLFENEAEALRFYEVGALCEPPPSMESIILANGLINSAPVVADITDPPARRRLANRIYRVSRAMIGDELADRLGYPPMRTTGTLTALRWRTGAERLLHRYLPALGRHRRASQFEMLMNVSLYVEDGVRYRLPEHLHAEKDGEL